MAGRFFLKGRKDELRNGWRTEPQTFGKRLRLKIQRFVLRNCGDQSRGSSRRQRFKNGFFWSENLGLYFCHSAAAQLRGSYCSSIAQGMLHLENGRRAINRKKRIVEKEHGEQKANAHVPGRKSSPRTGMFRQGHCSTFTIVKNGSNGQ
jgi:hypothetical protein